MPYNLERRNCASQESDLVVVYFVAVELASETKGLMELTQHLTMNICVFLLRCAKP